MFDTVLVANRGEIAVRVIRTLRRLGIRSVAVYSDADAGARHVREADVAVRIGPARRARELPVASSGCSRPPPRTGAQAVHPGYGFLSENTAFAQACADAGLVFIGPPARAVEVMGDKIRAKQTVAPPACPSSPAAREPGMTDADLRRRRRRGRLPGAGQAVRRRWRQGHAPGARRRRRCAEALVVRAPRGGRVASATTRCSSSAS